MNQVERLLRRVKVGHAGTLDPLASGVLMVCIGSTTRLIDRVQRMPKTYRTVIRLGSAKRHAGRRRASRRRSSIRRIPDESEVRRVVAARRARFRRCLPDLLGTEGQGPSRSTIWPDRARPSTLHPAPCGSTGSTCSPTPGPASNSKSIAGEGLTSGPWHETWARRWAAAGWSRSRPGRESASFTVDDAVDPTILTRESLPVHLRSPLEAVPDLPRIRLDETQVVEARPGPGARLSPDSRLRPLPRGRLALLGPDGRLVAIGEVDPGGNIWPRGKCLHERAHMGTRDSARGNGMS